MPKCVAYERKSDFIWAAHFFAHKKKADEIKMNEKTNSYLETAPVGSLMKKYSIPCIISLLVAALYNIVDQIFIANASYLGSYGNAANTVVFPLTVIALAIAVCIGDGCCAFVSISLGANKKDDAHKSVGNAIILCIAASVLLTAVYLIFSEPILTFFGGRVNPETFACAKEYFFWITLGIPFYMFGQAMNPIIRSDGSPRFAMVATVSGAVVNIILDPIFIFPMKMGMMGAAVATVAGQILTAGLSLYYICHMKMVKLHRSSFGLWGGLMKSFLPLGITSFLAQISLVISMAAVQNMVTKYGALDPVFGLTEYAQIPLAVLGIVMKFFQIAISISIGLAAGCIPVVGFNRGAGRNDRVLELFKKLLITEFIIGLAALAIVEFFPQGLINIFGAQNESEYYTRFAIRCFRIYLCMMPIAMLNKGTFIYLQAVGKAVLSTTISMAREIIFGVFLPILLPIVFGLDGILYSFPLADILTFIIAVIIIVKMFKELSAEDTAAGEKNIETAAKISGTALTDYIITIGRSYGAGGRTVGRETAERLNIPYYDSELLRLAAEEKGLNLRFLQHTDEKPIESNLLYLPVAYASNEYAAIAEQAASAQKEIIERVAEEGPCVIVGRSADIILSAHPKLLRVFVTGNQETRINRIVKRESLSADEAARKVNRVDKERAAYYNQHMHGKWGASDNYDLILNTDWYSFEECANIIAESVKN